MRFRRRCQLILTFVFILFSVLYMPAQHKVKKIGGYSEEFFIKEWKKCLKKYPVPENAIELEKINSFPSAEAEKAGVYLWRPLGIISIPNNRILINDQKVNKIFMFDSNGNFIKTFGRPGQGPGEFGNPFTLTADSEFIYVGDNSNRRIHFFDFDGNLILDIKMFKSLFDLERGKNGLFYGVPLRSLSEDNLVDVLNENGEIVNSIGVRKYGDKDSNWQIPNMTNISLNENNELYMAFKFFPLVRKYAENGELLQEYHLKHKVMQDKAAMNKEKIKNSNANPGFGWRVAINAILAQKDGFAILNDFPRTKIIEYTDAGRIKEIYYYKGDYNTLITDFIIVEIEGNKHFYLLKTQPKYEVIVFRPKARLTHGER